MDMIFTGPGNAIGSLCGCQFARY